MLSHQLYSMIVHSASFCVVLCLTIICFVILGTFCPVLCVILIEISLLTTPLSIHFDTLMQSSFFGVWNTNGLLTFSNVKL